MERRRGFGKVLRSKESTGSVMARHPLRWPVDTAEDYDAFIILRHDIT